MTAPRERRRPEPLPGPSPYVLFLKYTGLRALLFGAVLAVLLVVGVEGVLLVALAVLGSALLAAVLFTRQRAELSEALALRAEARVRRRQGEQAEGPDQL